MRGMQRQTQKFVRKFMPDVCRKKEKRSLSILLIFSHNFEDKKTVCCQGKRSLFCLRFYEIFAVDFLVSKRRRPVTVAVYVGKTVCYAKLIVEFHVAEFQLR